MKKSILDCYAVKSVPFAFGCEPLGGFDSGNVDLPSLYLAIEKAWDMGVRVFDTADVYGLGESEKQLSKVLGTRRHDAIIVSKFGCRWETSSNTKRAKIIRDASPEYVESAVNSSLKRLNVDTLSCYLLHWPDINTPLVSTLEALEKCRDAGKISSYGLSNIQWSAYEPYLNQLRIDIFQGPFSLIQNYKIKENYISARAAGVGTLTYGSLGQGLLSGKYTCQNKFSLDDRRSRLPQFTTQGWKSYQKLLDVLKNASKAHQKTVSQVALRWILEQDIATAIIIGAKTTNQIEENMGAANWNLDKEWITQLNNVSGIKQY
jgi:aryl-alcohol dehydrogenase-like predicted oxidoreductase